MAWTLEFTEPARKALRKLGNTDADRITRMLAEITSLDDPRMKGLPLTGGLAGLWRYRIGDWRVVCRIEDSRLLVLVLKIGHRRGVYRG